MRHFWFSSNSLGLAGVLLSVFCACGPDETGDPTTEVAGSPAATGGRSQSPTGGKGAGGGTAGSAGVMGKAGTVGSAGTSAQGEGTPIAGSTGIVGAPTAGAGGSPPRLGAGGMGLVSSVFEPPEGTIVGAGGTGTVPACSGGEPGTCDWTRVEDSGCCSQWACNRANREDVFDTYPIESCKSLVKCVKDHPGCSVASDPLCFQNEAASAPCLDEGYLASHLDPDGPYAWTLELMKCACGYE